MTLHEKTVTFYEADWQHTLFPLETTLVLMQNGKKLLDDLIYGKILASEKPPNFQQQVRVYADKSGGHLRRTMKLDPVAEVFLYDLLYRNRTKLPTDVIPGRKAFGYRFQNGEVVSAGASYRDFRKDVRGAADKFEYSLVCDISSYFNSIYHHDLEHCYRKSWSDEDTDHLGFFLRQVNGGRSVDCLPQGIMPAKILGHHFLRFIDYSGELKSECVLRFMDDIVLFSNSQITLENDFVVLQQLLGERALNINPRKTRFGYSELVHDGPHISDVRRQLLALRRDFIGGYEDDDDEEDDDEGEEEDDKEDEESLTGVQRGYLRDILSQSDIEEHDAELVLDLMREYPSSVIDHIPAFLANYPNLSRSIYRFCAGIKEREVLAEMVREFLVEKSRVSEYQLFWITKMAREYLSDIKQCGEILHALYEHPTGTVVSRAAVLEIPESRWGLPDIRLPHLRSGQSDWCAWAAAVGSRNEKRSARNHVLGYFANSGHINELIAKCIRSI